MVQYCGIFRAILDRSAAWRKAVRLDAHPVGVLVPINHLVAEHQLRRARAFQVAGRPVPVPHSQHQPRLPLHIHRLAEGDRDLNLVFRHVDPVRSRIRADFDRAHRRRYRVGSFIGHRLAAQSESFVSRHVADRARPYPGRNRIAHPDPRLPLLDCRVDGQLHRAPAHPDSGDRPGLASPRHREGARRWHRSPVERLVIGQRQRRPVRHRPAGSRQLRLDSVHLVARVGRYRPMVQNGVNVVRAVAVLDRAAVERKAVGIDAHPVGITLIGSHPVAEHQRRTRHASIARRPVLPVHVQRQLRAPRHGHLLTKGDRDLDIVFGRVGPVRPRIGTERDRAHLRGDVSGVSFVTATLVSAAAALPTASRIGLALTPLGTL